MPFRRIPRGTRAQTLGSLAIVTLVITSITSCDRRPQIEANGAASSGSSEADEGGGAGSDGIPGGESSESLRIMGRTAYTDRDLAGAIVFYQLSLDAAARIGQPIDPGLHSELGQVYLDQGWLPKAFEHFGQAIQSGRAPIASYVGMGDAYARQGRSSDAIAQWRTALKRNPSDSVASDITKKITDEEEKVKRNAFRPR